MEVGNKLTLFGLIPGTKINIRNISNAMSITSLSFIMMFRDGSGVFRTTICIIDPDGNEIYNFDFGELKKDHSDKSVIIAKVSPFPLAKLGSYIAVYKLDDKAYQREFFIEVSRI
jgi:hypothetical protein